MSRSGEKHAQDYNLILCILMALRATYFLSVIYGDPVLARCTIYKYLSSDAFYTLKIIVTIQDVCRNNEI